MKKEHKRLLVVLSPTVLAGVGAVMAFANAAAEHPSMDVNITAAGLLMGSMLMHCYNSVNRDDNQR